MKTLFEGTSEYYAQYRPPYPPKMLEDLVQKFNLDGVGKLLDIGCGPGILSIPLSKNFEGVVAIDIDSDMVQEGKKRADELGIKNIQWLVESADILDKSIGQFRLITLGASFHWLDRERFSKLAFDILENDGGMFISWTGNSLWNKERSIWEDKVLEIIKKYLGNERRAGNGLFKISSDKHEDILRKAGFKKMEFKQYPSIPQMLTIEDIIKGQYTNSYAAKNLFGDRAGDFENELTEELLKINPENKFEEKHVAGVIFIWKA